MTLSTDSSEKVNRHAPLRHAPLRRASQSLGVRNKRALKMELLEDRIMMSASPFHLQFGPANTAVDAGYTLATTAAYDPSVGFGWQGDNRLTAYNNSATDHGVQGPNGTFLVDLPNGTYQITATVGNAGAYQEDLKVSAQGLLELDYGDLQAAPGQYRQLTFQASVSQGQLSINLKDTQNPFVQQVPTYFSLMALDIASVSATPPTTQLPAGALPTGPSMFLQNYANGAIPTNQAGDAYPSSYWGGVYGEGGPINSSVSVGDGPFGNSLNLQVTQGDLYAQFNPYNAAGTRTFAHDYAVDPSNWQYNTYNRMAIWIKIPTDAPGVGTIFGNFYDFQVGTFVKSMTSPQWNSDELGGGNHYYHLFGVLNSGTWQQVILNMHPNEIRSGNSYQDLGVLSNPTGDGYNYFDDLTRFYIEELAGSDTYPLNYQIGGIQFYSQPNENDAQIYSMDATYDPSSNNIWVSYSHKLGEDSVYDDVRYSFTDIHQIGWDAATPAPDGGVGIAPRGGGSYNGRIYQNNTLPLAGHSVVYIAIKPENSDTFSEVAIPLNLDSSQPPGDTTTPTVRSVTPNNGATGVSAGTRLTVSFSEAMNAASLSSSTIQIHDSRGNLVPATVSYNSSSYQATVTPSQPLAFGSSYALTVLGGAGGAAVADANGNNLAVTFTSNFTTDSPPTVTGATPSDGTTGVGLTPTISVAVSEDLNASSVSTATVQLKDSVGNSVPITVSYNSASDTIIVNPVSPLANGTTYTLTIDGGSDPNVVADLAGTPLAADFTSSFTTLASVPSTPTDPPGSTGPTGPTDPPPPSGPTTPTSPAVPVQIGPIANQKMSTSQTQLSVPLSVTASPQAQVQYSVVVAGNPGWFWDRDLKLQAGNSTHPTNYGGANEKWFLGKTNSYGNSWYYLTPDGSLSAWSGAVRRATGTLLTKLPPIYYLYPDLLCNATTESLAYIVRQRLGLSASSSPYPLLSIAGIRWFVGATNSYGNRWYFLTSTGSFYAWDSRGYWAGGKLLANFDPIYYTQPSLLANAQPNQFSVSVQSNALTINRTGCFVGCLYIEVTASDGTTSDSARFTVNVASQTTAQSPLVYAPLGRQLA